MITTCISLDKEEREALSKLERPGLSMSQLVRDAIREKYMREPEVLPVESESSNVKDNESSRALDQLFRASTPETSQRFFKRKNEQF